MECNGRHSSILEIRNPEMRGQIYIEAEARDHARAAVGESNWRGRVPPAAVVARRGVPSETVPPAACSIPSPYALGIFKLMDAARATDEGEKPSC